MNKYIYMMLKAARRACWINDDCPCCIAANQMWAFAKQLDNELANDIMKKSNLVMGCTWCPLRTVIHEYDLDDSCSVYGKRLLEKYERFFDKDEE